MRLRGIRVQQGNAAAVRDVTEKRGTRPCSRRLRNTGLVGLALAGLLSITPATMASEFLNDGGASPARGTAQVVAQTVVDFGDGSLAWRVDDGAIDAAGERFAAPSDGFLIGDEGVFLVTDEATGAIQRIAAGEALALRDGASYEQQALGQEAVFFFIGLGEAGSNDLFQGASFDETGGLRDVDLLRDTLKAGGRAKLPAGDGPTLVMATAGEVRVVVEGDEVATLQAGEAVEASGALQIIASQDGKASYVAGIIGERLDGDGDGTGATPVSGGQGSGGGAPVVEVPVDSDGDGVDDQVEGQIGTDPANADTDFDGLPDGDEVNTYGSDPRSIDGDGDGLPDYNEVAQHGTNPADADSDNDGLNDHDELNLGTLPLDPDTDDDGLSDGYEVDHGANFFEPDTDQDGLLDGDEVHVYGSSPTSMDTDGDQLPDYNEVMQHGTSPALYDTDADNMNDHDELLYNTDLLDPDSDDDGALDGDEILGGYNPLDPNSKP